jgi:hypothetical protein
MIDRLNTDSFIPVGEPAFSAGSEPGNRGMISATSGTLIPSPALAQETGLRCALQFAWRKPMKRRLSLFLPLVVFLLASASVHAQSKSASGSSSGLDQLKSLAGSWEGTTSSGKSTRISYELASGGTALLERLHSAEESEMITVYTADGSRVAMTHYCSANNQPQMQTAPISGPANKFTFSFVRATNLASPSAGHMHQLVITVQDHDHFTQEWTWVEKGQTKTELFRFTRKS